MCRARLSAQLRRGLDGTARVRTSDCLDDCDDANVIVVQPSAAGRRAGGRPVWLGLVNHMDAADAIGTWIGAESRSSRVSRSLHSMATRFAASDRAQ